MERRNLIGCLLAASILAGIPAAAEEPQERWQRMAPEERRQMREQIREHWKQMTPEERETKMERMRERMSRMTPEERERMREQLRRHRRHMGNMGGAGLTPESPP